MSVRAAPDAIVSALVVTALSLVCTVAVADSDHHDQLGCGVRAVDTFLIHHGTPSKQGAWPWHAAIFLPNGNELQYACGGTIIGVKAILTAAHCAFQNNRRVNDKDVSVHVGRVDLRKLEVGYQPLRVSQFVTHPGFNPIGTVMNDIAVVQIKYEISVTPSVRPVCLWQPADGDRWPFEGAEGTVVGFGVNEHGQLPGYLQETKLTVVDVYTCLDDVRTGLTRETFCAGGQGKNPAGGDSGGGLVLERNGVWYLRGIVSFTTRPTISWSKIGTYTVFMDVTKYHDFIAEHTNDRNTEAAQAAAVPVKIKTPKYPKRRLKRCLNDLILDGTICNMADRFDHGFLLVDQESSIIRIPLNDTRHWRSYRFGNVNGIGHDCARGRFYWANLDSNRISSANYDGADKQDLIDEGIVEAMGVAVDWVSRRLYWTDAKKNTIEVASLENPSLRTVLFTKLEEPVAIAVDPFRRKLYWLTTLYAWKIEWSNLDGTDRRLLLGGEQIGKPYRIAVSLASGELCYTDWKSNTVECIEPKSKQIRTVVDRLQYPRGLAITDELTYWTDPDGETIESIDRDGLRRQSITLDGDYIYDILAVTDKCPIFYSPCAANNGGCPVDTICLVSKAAPSGKVCKCTQNCEG